MFQVTLFCLVHAEHLITKACAVPGCVGTIEAKAASCLDLSGQQKPVLFWTCLHYLSPVFEKMPHLPENEPPALVVVGIAASATR